MPLPNLPIELPDGACVVLAAAVKPSIILPGGVAIQGIAGTETGDAGKIIRSLLQAIYPALAPFLPLFDIAEAFKAVAEMGEATIPPDPIKFAEAFGKLIEKVTKLTALLPQMAIPNLARSVIITIAAGLEALRGQLASMIAHNERIASAFARAATLREPARSALLATAECARSNLDIQLQNENESLEPLNRLIGLVNTMLELIKLPCIPSIGAVDLDPGALDALSAVIDLLNQLAALIPSADFELPGLPPAGEC